MLLQIKGLESRRVTLENKITKIQPIKRLILYRIG